jgi:hypothetical protein
LVQGNVGIGTATSPAAELQVGKSSDVTIAMSNSSSVTSGNRGGIAWYNSNVSTVANIRAFAVTDNVGTELQFYTRPAAGSLTQVLTLASTGAATFSSSVSSLAAAGATFVRAATSGGSDVRITSGASVGFVGTTSNHSLSFVTNNNVVATIGTDAAVNFGGSVLAVGITSSASVAFPHTTKTADYTLNANDYTVGFDCASNRTATLPDATTCAGRIYVIYQYNTNIGLRYVTIDGNGSQTINGQTTLNLQYQDEFSSVMIQSNGSNWVIIASALYAAPV